ncbi:hypothetical protein EXS62_02460 [Candidatus Kaiserbacteria bacterium]|nr:hypothetical protein [Candidatus Kaiserbacteria bacterium]
MKTRDYKTFAPGEYYHLFNRGNGKMDVFADAADYSFFLSRLEEYLFPERRRAPPASRYERKSFPIGSFTLLSYCLMPNHYHLLLRQNSSLSLSSLMLGLTTGYSKYFNKKYARVGSLFQDQFKAVGVSSNEQLLWLSAYIHQNPKISGLVEHSEEYPYSSYRTYLTPGGVQLCDTKIVLEQFLKRENYQEYVESSLDAIKSRKAKELSAEGALLQSHE